MLMMLPVGGKQRLINQMNIVQIFEHEENRRAIIEMSSGTQLEIDLPFKDFINSARPAQGNIVVPQAVPTQPLR